jgi:DNA-binding protein H-NS
MTMPTVPNGKDTKTTLSAPASGAATAPKPPASVLAIDLEGQDDEGLATLIEDAKTVLARRKAKREADFFALIDEQARALNIPPARLLATLRAKAAAAGPGAVTAADGSTIGGRAVVAPKYRNPKDASQTWSGRGGQPQWIKDHVAAGGSEEDRLIPE